VRTRLDRLDKCDGARARARAGQGGAAALRARVNGGRGAAERKRGSGRRSRRRGAVSGLPRDARRAGRAMLRCRLARRPSHAAWKSRHSFQIQDPCDLRSKAGERPPGPYTPGWDTTSAAAATTRQTQVYTRFAHAKLGFPQLPAADAP
jgi:hypothetical protein